jgi:hypothetical protein
MKKLTITNAVNETITTYVKTLKRRVYFSWLRSIGLNLESANDLLWDSPVALALLFVIIDVCPYTHTHHLGNRSVCSWWVLRFQSLSFCFYILDIYMLKPSPPPQPQKREEMMTSFRADRI